MTDLDVSQRGQLDLRRLPGEGLLARCGELVLLCEGDPRQDARVGVLLDALAAVGAAQPCGRRLSRRLAWLVSTAEIGGFPALCAFGPAGDGIAAVVHGRAEILMTAGGRQVRLDGRDAVTVVDRVVAEPIDSIRAMVGEGSNSLVYRRTRLPAPALALAPAGTPPTGTQPAAAPPTAAPPLAAASAPAPVEPVEEAAEPTGHGEVELSAVRPGRAAVRAAWPWVSGVYCDRAHFNDPTVAYCVACGASLVGADRSVVSGLRPVLGMLVFDDGIVLPLDRDHVFGRSPELDPVVSAGAARPVRLPDPLLSRLHARVELVGWDVRLRDAGSMNGTFLWRRGDRSWSKLPRGGTADLRPDTLVAFGRRQFRWHSYRHW
jgi:hypothetical protein